VDTGSGAAWETHATWWQEGFTDGADPEYTEQILPLAAAELAARRCVLDVGCGEGQIARYLLDRAAVGGAAGVDPSQAQLDTARRRGGGPSYARAFAHRLPFAPASFDGVLACLVFEHIEALDEAIGEVARVLEPGGIFLLLCNHPLLQAPGSGWIDDHILEEQYWRVGEYLRDGMTMEEIAPGVALPFVHRPMSRYLNRMAEVGLRLEWMHEPPPPPGFLARAPEYAQAATIPRLLALRARRGEPVSGPAGAAGRHPS